MSSGNIRDGLALIIAAIFAPPALADEPQFNWTTEQPLQFNNEISADPSPPDASATATSNCGDATYEVVLSGKWRKNSETFCIGGTVQAMAGGNGVVVFDSEWRRRHGLDPLKLTIKEAGGGSFETMPTPDKEHETVTIECRGVDHLRSVFSSCEYKQVFKSRGNRNQLTSHGIPGS